MSLTNSRPLNIRKAAVKIPQPEGAKPFFVSLAYFVGRSAYLSYFVLIRVDSWFSGYIAKLCHLTNLDFRLK